MLSTIHTFVIDCEASPPRRSDECAGSIASTMDLKDLRAQARDAGWLTVREEHGVRRDYCPKCAPLQELP